MTLTSTKCGVVSSFKLLMVLSCLWIWIVLRSRYTQTLGSSYVCHPKRANREITSSFIGINRTPNLGFLLHMADIVRPAPTITSMSDRVWWAAPCDHSFTMLQFLWKSRYFTEILLTWSKSSSFFFCIKNTSRKVTLFTVKLFHQVLLTPWQHSIYTHAHIHTHAYIYIYIYIYIYTDGKIELQTIDKFFGSLTWRIVIPKFYRMTFFSGWILKLFDLIAYQHLMVI